MRCASGLALDTLSCPKRGSSVRRQGDRMTEPRHREPLPLGGDGIPYSKGLMARALTATGVKTMRAFFAKDFMPSIHYSSFEADAAVSQDESDPVVRGFLDQTRNVLVGVDAALDRARQEGWSMVLEGVHIVPGMVPAELEGAIFVQCVLSIQHEAAHASHFTIRDALSDGVRPMAKYVDRLPEIRRIQDLILERARRTDIPVIENTSLEDTAGKVMELV